MRKKINTEKNDDEFGNVNDVAEFFSLFL